MKTYIHAATPKFLMENFYSTHRFSLTLTFRYSTLLFTRYEYTVGVGKHDSADYDKSSEAENYNLDQRKVAIN